MKLAMIFGQFAPEDGNGLVDLGLDLMRLSLVSSVRCFQQDDSIEEPYDIYIGHSFGGDKAVETIRKFPKDAVQYLALIDPVKKGWLPFFWLPSQNFSVPLHVKRAQCFQRQHGWLPPSSPIRNPSRTFENFQVATSHGDAPRSPFVQATIEEALKTLFL